ncbi:hypothetical protein K438DRAFT_2025932 [Mycena galopus ATCC 62051]|nr:hypothetical protein K438DRAFT_2025932 [Mycena galopus ATCC 62051]
MQSSCPASPHPPACSPTLSLLNLSRPPGRRRPATPEAFAVLTNARLGFCATPTLCESAPRYCAKNPSAYQHSYPSVVAPRPDGALGILAAHACAPAAYAAPMRRPPLSTWTSP